MFMHLSSQLGMKTTQIIQMTCLADFAASNIYGKGDINYGPDDEKSYIKSVAEIQEEEDLKTTVTIKLKNDLGKMGRELC